MIVWFGIAAAPRQTHPVPRAEFLSAADATWQPSQLWADNAQNARLPSDDSAPSHGLSQVVLEGSLVNLDVTSPGATLALTLMFVQTNDRAAASVLTLPDTNFTLDFVRPFYILLRILARSLILWDSVRPTEEWVTAQLPAVLRRDWKDSVTPMREAAADGREFDWEAVLLGHIYGVAGAALAIGLRYAGALPVASAADRPFFHDVSASFTIASLASRLRSEQV